MTPVAARSKTWVCGPSLAGIIGSNPVGGHGCLSLMSVVWFEVEVSASGRSLFQRSPTKCGAPQCDREPSIMSRPWSTTGYRTVKTSKKARSVCVDYVTVARRGCLLLPIVALTANEGGQNFATNENSRQVTRELRSLRGDQYSSLSHTHTSLSN